MNKLLTIITIIIYLFIFILGIIGIILLIHNIMLDRFTLAKDFKYFFSPILIFISIKGILSEIGILSKK